MKVLSLNTWGGGGDRDVKLQQPLLDFVSRMSATVDVFCFQEIWSKDPKRPLSTGGRFYQVEPWFNIFKDLMRALPGFTHLFHQYFADAGGLAMFYYQGSEGNRQAELEYFRASAGRKASLAKPYRASLTAVDSGDFFVYKSGDFIPEDDLGHHARNIEYVTFETPRGKRTVMNFHGLWKYEAGKVDLPERIEQSRKILDFVNRFDHPFILIGDFNLMPDTESITMLENAGLRNLIMERGITSTRTSYYKKPERYADYAFVSEGITVNDFQVLPDEVSDHAPLYLDFD